MKEHLTAVKQTYQDYTMRILRQYKDGDYIISEFVMEGTHEGEWIEMCIRDSLYIPSSVQDTGGN